MFININDVQRIVNKVNTQFQDFGRFRLLLYVECMTSNCLRINQSTESKYGIHTHTGITENIRTNIISPRYLSVCLHVCPINRLSIYLFTCLSVCLSNQSSVCLSVYLSIYLSVCLSVHLIIHTSSYVSYVAVNAIDRPVCVAARKHSFLVSKISIKNS